MQSLTNSSIQWLTSLNYLLGYSKSCVKIFYFHDNKLCCFHQFCSEQKILEILQLSVFISQCTFILQDNHLFSILMDLNFFFLAYLMKSYRKIHSIYYIKRRAHKEILVKNENLITMFITVECYFFI